MRDKAIKDMVQDVIACSETDPTPPRYTLAELQLVMDWAKREGLTAHHVLLKYYACRTVAANINAELAFKWRKDTRREVINVFGKDGRLLESIDCGGVAAAAMLTRRGRLKNEKSRRWILHAYRRCGWLLTPSQLCELFFVGYQSCCRSPLGLAMELKQSKKPVGDNVLH